MNALIRNLAKLIFAKRNKIPSDLFISSLNIFEVYINKKELNINSLVRTIKTRSYKAYIIFTLLTITPKIEYLIYVLVNIGKYNICIDVKKVALGFITNIYQFREHLDMHLFIILEEIQFNAIIYSRLKKQNTELCKEYEKKVFEMSDDLLEFYIGMYEIYIKIKCFRDVEVQPPNEEVNNLLKFVESYKRGKTFYNDTIPDRNTILINNTESTINTLLLNQQVYKDLVNEFGIKKHFAIFKQIFLMGRSDFIENLFFNLRQMKKMSKLGYTHVLQETFKSIFQDTKEYDRFEILLSEKDNQNFNLYFIVDNPLNEIFDKKYILKLGKIFKFLYKCKKIEYLARKTKNFNFLCFIKKLYFYMTEDIFEKFYTFDELFNELENILSLTQNENLIHNQIFCINKNLNVIDFLKKKIEDNIDLILKNIYLDNELFYGSMKEIEKVFMDNYLQKTDVNDSEIVTYLENLYQITENDVFL